VNARDEVLRRVRAALADVPPDEDVEVPRGYLRSVPSDVDVLGLFEERVADYRATVRRVGASALAGAVAAALEEHEVRRLVVPADLPADWLAATTAEAVRDDGTLTASELDRFDGVVTAAAVGIAETGTIVLDAGPAQGRRALSLVPDLHLCVVRADQVVGTVPEGVSRLLDGAAGAAGAAGMAGMAARPLTWISGPSATSDIELRRVEGVHGPRTLIVLIVAGP
jgi:L-lactate dehydrogenase complex protein LldG